MTLRYKKNSEQQKHLNKMTLEDKNKNDLNGKTTTDTPTVQADDEKVLDAKSERKKNEGVPVDQGYAWVICLSVFVAQVLRIGFNGAMSVLLLDIKEEFNTSMAVVTLCFSVRTILGSCSSLVVSNFLMLKYTVRTLSLISAIGGAIGTVLLSLSPNITVFLGAMVIKGITFAVLLVCPNSLVGHYFKKRRGLATALCNTGFCVSYIIFPPLIEFLNSEFGLRGCLLILAAIELNLAACSMLLLSPEIFKKRFRACHMNAQPETNGGQELVEVKDKFKTVDLKGKKDDKGKLELQINPEETVKLLKQHLDTKDKAEYSEAMLSCSPKSVVSFSPPGSPVDSHLGNTTPVLSRKPESRLPMYERKLSFYTSQRSLSVRSDVPYFEPDIEDSDIESGAEHEIKAEKKAAKTWKDYVYKFFDPALFKIRRFCMYALFAPMSSFNTYLLVYMPLIALMAGLSKPDGAFLMVISGVMDLVARIVLAFLSDFKWFSKYKIVSFSLGVLAVVCHGARIINNYSLFVAFAVIVGVFGGVRQNLSSGMVFDYVGVELFPKAFGFLATICTLVLSINHPVIGSLLDVTGSFVIPLHYVGAVLTLAIIILLTEPCCKRVDQKRLAIMEAAKTAEV